MIPDYFNVIHTSLHNMPQRLKAFDPKLFVTRNEEVYTIWRDLDDDLPAKIMDIHYTAFDGSVIERLRAMDSWSRDDFFANMDAMNESILAIEREYVKGEAEYAAREMERVGTVQHFLM